MTITRYPPRYQAHPDVRPPFQPPPPWPPSMSHEVIVVSPNADWNGHTRRPAPGGRPGVIVGWSSTGFFGVGGGFIIVRPLALALGFEMPIAVGSVAPGHRCQLRRFADLEPGDHRCRLARRTAVHRRRAGGRGRRQPPGEPSARTDPAALVRRAARCRRHLHARPLSLIALSHVGLRGDRCRETGRLSGTCRLRGIPGKPAGSHHSAHRHVPRPRDQGSSTVACEDPLLLLNSGWSLRNHDASPSRPAPLNR